MSEPSVVAICITADRPEMTKQAVESFRRQTYQNKRLLILDTGASRDDAHVYLMGGNANNERLLWNPSASETIGELRNIAARQSDADILIHFDSDDLSHPNRIAEQVALLQSSGAEVCGYNEAIFWREPCQRDTDGDGNCPEHRNGCGSREAWLYRNPHPAYAIGSSLCYWRATWQWRLFEATSVGEDQRFIAGLKCFGVSAMGGPAFESEGGFGQVNSTMPRLLCRIHPGNTSQAYRPEEMRAVEKRGGEWSRVSSWDRYCETEFAR